MTEHQPFTWLGGLTENHAATAGSALIATLLLVFAASVRRKLADTEQALVPDERPSGRSIAEAFVEAIEGIAQTSIGHHAERYVPLLCSFFALILCSNLLGLVPGFSPPTSNFNVTLGLGLISFTAYNLYGLKANGAGYIRQFMGPVLLLAPLMFGIELVGHMFRPISLALRLFANLFADHQVIERFTELTYVGAVVFYLFGTLVSVVQAFVFTTLTAVYIGLAISHDH